MSSAFGQGQEVLSAGGCPAPCIWIRP